MFQCWTGTRFTNITEDSPGGSPEIGVALSGGSNLSREFESARGGEGGYDDSWGTSAAAEYELGAAVGAGRERAAVERRTAEVDPRVMDVEACASAVEATHHSASAVTPTQVVTATPINMVGPGGVGGAHWTAPTAARGGLPVAGQGEAAVSASELAAARRDAERARIQADLLRVQVSQLSQSSDLALALKSISGSNDKQERRRVAADFKKRIGDSTSVEDAANILHEIARLPLDSRAATVRKAVSGHTFDGAMHEVRLHDYEFRAEAEWTLFCAGFMEGIDSNCIGTISDKLMTGLPWPTAGNDEVSKLRTAKSAASALASTYAWLGSVVFNGGKRAALSFEASAATEARCLLLSMPSGVRSAIEDKLNNDPEPLSTISGFERIAAFELQKQSKAGSGSSPSGDRKRRQEQRPSRDEDRAEGQRPPPRKEGRRGDSWQERGGLDRDRRDRLSGDRFGRSPRNYENGDGFDHGRRVYERGHKGLDRRPQIRPQTWQGQQTHAFAAAAHAQQPQGFVATQQPPLFAPIAQQAQAFAQPQPVFMAPQAFAGQNQTAFYQPVAAAASVVQPPPPTYPPSAAAAHEQPNACYNCGDPDHFKAQCPHGPKCYNCGEFGHLRRECPRKMTSRPLNGRR